MLCTQIVFGLCFDIQNNLCTQTQHVLPVFSPCSELVIFLYWTCNSMNNLFLNCRLVDARISASEKDLTAIYLNLIYSEKATKICETFTLLLTGTTRTKVRFLRKVELYLESTSFDISYCSAVRNSDRVTFLHNRNWTVQLLLIITLAFPNCVSLLGLSRLVINRFAIHATVFFVHATTLIGQATSIGSCNSMKI